MKLIGKCPHCKYVIKPVRNDGTGRAQYSVRDSNWLAINPAMCPECFGVGSWWDFGIDVLTDIGDVPGRIQPWKP